MQDIKDFIKWFSTQSPETIDKINTAQLKKDREDYNDFVEKLARGECKYCGKNLDYFNKKETCFHWLLRPNGVRTRNIKRLLDHYGLIRVRAYLRWLAHSERALTNINDLREEQSDHMIVHESIKYKTLKYTLHCSETDFTGHRDSNFPHYHFQMILNGLIFFKFSQHHAKLLDTDIFELKLLLEHPDMFAVGPFFGAGIQNMFDAFKPEELLEHMEPSTDENFAPFNVQTMVVAKNGHKIPGSKIMEIYELSKKENITIAQAIRKSDLEADITTMINPSDNLPLNSQRTKPRNKK